MRSFAAALVCLLAFAACRRAEAPAPAAANVAAEKPALPESDNLLNLVFGTAVVDRSDELSYENSIVHALDGARKTNWASAPGGKQSATLSLPAPSRIHRVGASIFAERDHAPAGIRFETSLDGKTWQKAVEGRFKHDNHEPQLFGIDPAVEARYLRATAIEPAHRSHILSLHAHGVELAPVTQQPLEGCWEINMNVPARFARMGARVAGTIGPMIVDGGADGRVYRLMWREQAMWGYAAVSVTPDGLHLSGLRWHEEVNAAHTGDGWLGKRVPCTDRSAIDTARIVEDIIGRAGRWRLYGIRWEAQDRIVAAESANTLDLVAKIVRDHPSHRFRVVAREFREPTEEKNRARCTAKLNAVREALQARRVDLARIELVVAGSERGPLTEDYTSLRAMESGVELQVVAAR